MTIRCVVRFLFFQCNIQTREKSFLRKLRSRDNVGIRNQVFNQQTKRNFLYIHFSNYKFKFSSFLASKTWFLINFCFFFSQTEGLGIMKTIPSVHNITARKPEKLQGLFWQDYRKLYWLESVFWTPLINDCEFCTFLRNSMTLPMKV